MHLSSIMLMMVVMVLGMMLKETNAQDTCGYLAAGLGGFAIGNHFNGGGGGGGRNRNHNRGFFGRRRRQAEELENELDPMVVELFRLSLKTDLSRCNLLLVCSVGSRPSSILTGRAKDIESAFSTKPTENSFKDDWSDINAYRVALNFGRDGGNCTQLFPDCPESPVQLMDAIQST